MNAKDRIALRFPSLVLRIVLGLTFIWAGLGKVSTSMPVSGADAAILANAGIPLKPAEAAPAPAPAQPEEVPAAPESENASGGVQFRLVGHMQEGDSTVTPDASAQNAGAMKAASDFQSPMSVRTMYMVSLGLHHASHPAPKPDGTPGFALWPDSMASSTWLKWLALAVVIAELGGGVMVLIGLLTRLWAFGLVTVMLGAMWLTQFGPAIQSGAATWGFLPNLPTFDPGWQTLGWQLSLGAGALAVVLGGPGAAAIDNILFTRSPEKST